MRPGGRRVDDDRRAKPRLDRLDPALEERLLLAGGVVLGVLLEVAVLLGGPDPGDDLRPLDQGQLVELGPQACLALGGQRHGPDGWRAQRGARATSSSRVPRSGGAFGTVRGAPGGAARRFGAGGSPRAPRHRRRAPSRRGSAASGGSTGSAISDPVNPVARRSPVGRSQVRPRQDDARGPEARPGPPPGRPRRTPPAGRPRIPRSPAVGGPPDLDAVERAERLEPVAARRPVGGRRARSVRWPRPVARPSVGRRRRRARSATAARRTRAGPPAPSRTAARHRAGASRPVRSTCRPAPARSARTASGAGSSMTKTPGPWAGTGRPQTAGTVRHQADRAKERGGAGVEGHRPMVQAGGSRYGAAIMSHHRHG